MCVGGWGAVFPQTAILLPHILKCNWVMKVGSHRRRGRVGNYLTHDGQEIQHTLILILKLDTVYADLN